MPAYASAQLSASRDFLKEGMWDSVKMGDRAERIDEECKLGR
jgi:hypothetical protein